MLHYIISDWGKRIHFLLNILLNPQSACVGRAPQEENISQSNEKDGQATRQAAHSYCI